MSNKAFSCAIAGGTGYTAGELLRILLPHPDVQVVAVQSSSQAGKPLSNVHHELLGETDLIFCEQLPPTDVLFLCLGHGLSRQFLENQPPAPHTKVIDLGNDFRPSDLSATEPAPQGLDFVYGLPEAYRTDIIKARALANPGCFATAIQLALLPLAAQGQLLQDVHIHAITGSTGAGRSLSETSHFSYRDNNISIYKPFSHQHLPEIRHTLTTLGAQTPVLHFIPVRGNFSRGIFASLYTPVAQPLEEIAHYYREFYRSHPFVHITDFVPSLKEVVNTNKCYIHLEKHGDMLLLTSIIDNLIKGASGQAVQNMNLMLQLDETRGLHLKPSVF